MAHDRRWHRGFDWVFEGLPYDLVAAEDHGLFISECVVSERVGRST